MRWAGNLPSLEDIKLPKQVFYFELQWSKRRRSEIRDCFPLKNIPNLNKYLDSAMHHRRIHTLKTANQIYM